MFKFLRPASIVIVGAIVVGSASAANAAALYFERVLVQTNSEATCFRFAGHAAYILQFQNIRSNRLEVAGEKNGAYVSITCIGRGQSNAMAVVMAVSPTFDVAKQVGSEAANKLKRITNFD
jgi:Trk K+ transport system NAD-binding subunit